MRVGLAFACVPHPHTLTPPPPLPLIPPLPVHTRRLEMLRRTPPAAAATASLQPSSVRAVLAGATLTRNPSAAASTEDAAVSAAAAFSSSSSSSSSSSGSMLSPRGPPHLNHSWCVLAVPAARACYVSAHYCTSGYPSTRPAPANAALARAGALHHCASAAWTYTMRASSSSR